VPEFPIALRGYHRAHVDAFVARIEGTLGRAQLFAPPVTAEEVSLARFPIALAGYRCRTVDQALDAYVRELERREGGRRRLPAADADRLVGMVRNVRFGTAWLTEGYAERDVDAFLDRMIVALRARRARSTDVRAARFGVTRVRRGYRQPEVDAFLVHLAAELDRLLM
jgi:DivIVA domain-containing protein